MSAAGPLPELEIEFAEPIEFPPGSGKQHTSIVLREPKAVEVQNALASLGAANTPDSMYKYNTALIAGVAGVQRQVVEKMPVRQFNAGAAYLESFLAAGPATGEN